MSEKQNEKVQITEEKAKRLIVAGTVGAVLLMAILLMVMIYQLISIGVKNRQIAEYNAAIARYETLIEEGEETIEVRQLEWWIRREAERLGFVFEGDKPYD